MYTYHHTISLMVDLIFANVKLFYISLKYSMIQDRLYADWKVNR